MARAVTWKNRERFKRRMAAIPRFVRDETERQLLANAQEMTEAMKRAVPIESGDLRESIKFKRIPGDRITVQVSAGDNRAFYARMVEFGTPKHRASPFFYPTYRANRRRLQGRLRRAMRKAARDVTTVG